MVFQKIFQAGYIFLYVIWFCFISLIVTLILFLISDVIFNTNLLDPEFYQIVSAIIVSFLIFCIFLVTVPPSYILHDIIHGPITSYSKTIKGRFFIRGDKTYIRKDDQIYSMKELLKDADNRLVTMRIFVADSQE